MIIGNTQVELGNTQFRNYVDTVVSCCECHVENRGLLLRKSLLLYLMSYVSFIKIRQE